ncbi:hypothetical protein KIKIMORA_04850 [Brevundimonas phage vB_BpoS-Kikimora]|uniref:Uncharacterized protein n=1 Tax=Brevundimonas phage vB_BpoS-Kikimora TaxID=2948601 RepID=A0A9E7MS10_9CAUD|nr:hypothetical protein KIKIMORA_04850 [Brevundimonas phage vB_BpoS-Kikimora]
MTARAPRLGMALLMLAGVILYYLFMLAQQMWSRVA